MKFLFWKSLIFSYQPVHLLVKPFNWTMVCIILSLQSFLQILCRHFLAFQLCLTVLLFQGHFLLQFYVSAVWWFVIYYSPFHIRLTWFWLISRWSTAIKIRGREGFVMQCSGYSGFLSILGFQSFYNRQENCQLHFLSPSDILQD